jgi:hypothetical protein
MPDCGRSGGLVDHFHDRSTVDGAPWVGIVWHHLARHDDL